MPEAKAKFGYSHQTPTVIAQWLIERYATEWDPNKHPREPKGSGKGGQFTGGKHFSDSEASEHRKWFESKPVSVLKGEFSKQPDDVMPLSKKVGKWFQDVHNGKAIHPEIGEVVLNERAAKDSISHGIGRAKSAAFAAVPDIISKGRILKTATNWDNHAGMTGFVIGAPIQIAEKKYAAIAIVRKDFNQAKFYLHEVQLIEKLQEDAFKTAATDKSVEPHGAPSGVVNQILSEIFESGNSASGKIIGSDATEVKKDKFSTLLSSLAQWEPRLQRYAFAPPTQAQREAGNYKKKHIRFQGLDISIETCKGQCRRPGWPKMPCDYGYIRGTRGKDGDHVDVFVGLNLNSPVVFVVDQVNQSKRFDEHKCLIGFNTEREAVDCYRRAYTAGWLMGKVTAMTIGQFRAWLANGSQDCPVHKQVSKYSIASV